MSLPLAAYLARLAPFGRTLRDRGLLLACDAAAHAHVAAVTGSLPGGPIHYTGLAPRGITVLGSDAEATREAARGLGLTADESPVADVVRGSLGIFGTEVVLADGTRLPVLTREAVLAELLARGGLAIGLAGALLRFPSDDPLDVDEVRELLKAARQPESFQPMFELLAIV